MPFSRLLKSCLALGALLASPVALQAADPEVYPHSAPQIRMEGRIVSVAPDLGSLELDLVVSTSPSGRRQVLSAPAPRRIRLAPGCYIYPRGDRAIFYTARELKPGDVAVVFAVQGGGSDLVTGEIQLGGQLPRLKPPAPQPPPAKGGEPERIALPALPSGLAKFEPRRGCYLGAFVMRDENVNGRMDEWEERVGKGHASYLRYVGYGRPFPEEWVREVRELGAVPNLALEPNGGLGEVRDNAYLRGFAKAAAASGGPVFLRFASEMNGSWTAYSGDPGRYRSKFRLVAGVMRKLARNVAMVWTPYCMPVGNIPDYYPGDDAVDWVGVNIYSVHHHNGSLESPAAHEDPTALLRPIYARYAARKPIQISEYAATNFCLACDLAVPAFAVRKMQKLYSSLPRQFPRVKMVYWFSWDTISGGAAENNYAVTAEPKILRAYQDVTRSAHFLSRLPVSAPRARREPPERTAVQAPN